MGFLFSYNQDQSNVWKLNSEKDFSSIKYLLTYQPCIKFDINSNRDEILQFTKDLFKYVYQKHTSVNQLQQIKCRLNFNLSNKDIFELFLSIQKSINKLSFIKKNERIVEINDDLSDKNLKPNFSIKILFNDALYRIKLIKESRFETDITIFFSYFTITQKNYSISILSKILLNDSNNTYDHLLCSNISDCYFECYTDYINNQIKKRKLDNLKLAPILSTSNKLGDFFTMVNSFNMLRIIDISFVVYIKEPDSLKLELLEILKNLTIIDDHKIEYIIRFYIFTNLTLHDNIEKFKKAFRRSIVNIKNKLNSYFLMYIFVSKEILCIRKVRVNPHMNENILDSLLLQDEANYLKMIKRDYRNRENFIKNFLPSHIMMTKSLIKIYARPYYQIYTFLYACYSKAGVAKKIKRNTILSIVCKFLSVQLYEKIYNDDEDPLSKNAVYLNYHAIQKESNLYREYGENTFNKIDDDSIHINYDQIFNLLRITK